jgi:tetratricopeptide (TPR) repeat protein
VLFEVAPIDARAAEVSVGKVGPVRERHHYVEFVKAYLGEESRRPANRVRSSRPATCVLTYGAVAELESHEMRLRWRRLPGVLATPILRTVLSLILWIARRKGTQRDALGLTSLAWRAIEGGRLTRGRILAETAIAADASYQHGYRMLAWASDRAGDLEDALSACERGLVAAPNDAALLRQAGDLQRRRNLPVEAEAYYRRALDLEGDDPRVLWELADAIGRQGRLDEEDGLLDRAVQIAPNDAHVLGQLGQLRRQRGQFESAIEVLARAVALNPRLAGAYYDLALSYTVLRQWDAAQRAIEQAVALQPENIEFQKLHRMLQNPEQLVIK